MRSRFGGLALLVFCLAMGVATAFVERAMHDSLVVFGLGVLIVAVVGLATRGVHPFVTVWWFCVANAPTFIILYYG